MTAEDAGAPATTTISLLADFAQQAGASLGAETLLPPLRQAILALFDAEAAWLVFPDESRNGFWAWDILDETPGKVRIGPWEGLIVDGAFAERALLRCLGLQGEEPWRLFPISASARHAALLIRSRAEETEEGTGPRALFLGILRMGVERILHYGAMSRAKAEWEKAFDASGDLFFFHDAKGRLFRANMAVSVFTGRTFLECIGARCSDLFPGLCADVDAADREWIDASSGRIFLASTQRVLLDATPAVLHVLHEVTEQRKLEALAGERRQTELTQKLLQGVAHEIRNPLFAISTVIQALQKKVGGEIETQPYTDYIMEQVRRLERLVQRFMLLAASAYSSPAGTTLRIEELIQNSMALVQERWPGMDLSRVQVALPEGTAVLTGDGSSLAWALSELIENALAFGPEDTPVEVVATATGETLAVSIRDYGPGLREEGASAIFDPFFTTRQGRVGLGLTVARSTVVHHGGTLEAEPCAPSPGIRFLVTLPRTVC